MKYLFAAIVLFLSFSVSAQHKKQDLVGTWEGADSRGTKASIQFLDTSKVIVIINGNAMPPYTYTIELPKNPAKLDITMLTPNGQTATLMGFLLFVDKNTIKWQIFPDGNRPENYDENANGPIITLKRTK